MTGTVASSSPVAVASAGFGRRFAALFIDCALSAGVAALFSRPDPPGLLSAGVFFVACTLFIGLFAQSPGMRLLGLACVRVSNCETSGGQLPAARIGVARAALRTVLLQLVVPAVITGADGRAWHDRAAGSVVVRVSR
ncbi:MAG: RDD family protein [Mycobacteriales bacterium]